jgi:pyruvate formate lyase activating enzyme
VDPIEKKPLYHFLPGSKVLSIGTFGCNFGCEFCQNWASSQASKSKRKKSSEFSDTEKLINITEERIKRSGDEFPPEKVVDYCVEKDIKVIAYTYNEPTIFAEYAFGTAKLAQKQNIKNVFVTNGYMSQELIPEMTEFIDAANIDLKSFRDDFYKKVCKGRLKPVLRNIELLHEKGVWIELTTLVIPGENDSWEELSDIAQFIASTSKDIPWHISRFRPDYQMTDKDLTPMESIERAYEIGKSAGLKFIYPGNIQDTSRRSTMCPECDAKLIDRSYYRGTFVREISDNKCPECSAEIPGVFTI